MEDGAATFPARLGTRLFQELALAPPPLDLPPSGIAQLWHARNSATLLAAPPDQRDLHGA